MLHRVTFKAEHRCFKKDAAFSFGPGLNLLVGDQGSGKTSLLNLLVGSARGDSHADSVIEVAVDSILVRSLDFEKGNPRMGKREVESIDDIAVMFLSHGETIKAQIRGMNGTEERTLFILDEPDLGLSPRSCHWLVKFLAEKAQKHQILAAVHNPILIASMPTVLSLDEQKWVSSQEFLTNHGEDNAG